MRYDSPIGGEVDRAGLAWPAPWFDATGFGRNTAAAYVKANGAYHTGAGYYLRVQREGINGKPSRMIAGTLFQMGGNGDPQRNRYEMRPYLDALGEIWRV